MAKKKPCKPKPKSDMEAWEIVARGLLERQIAKSANPAQVLTPVHIK